MRSPLKAHLRPAVLALGVLLTACGSAGYAVDSATSACRQNPAYCALVASEETVVPTAVLGATEVASVGAALRALNLKMQSDIEDALVECVEWANDQVNRRRFGGQNPSREQCQEELPGRDPCGKGATRPLRLPDGTADGSIQGDTYLKLLGVRPNRVAPIWRIIR